MPDKKEYVKLWTSYKAYFEAYSAAEVGRLVLAMIDYKSSGAEPEFSGSERFIWPAIKRDIDEARKAEAASSSQNRENANMRWHGSDATACEGMRTHAKACDHMRGHANDAKDKGQGQRTRSYSSPSDEGEDARAREEPAKGRFVPPTVEQVREYCLERGNNVDPEQFVDHYTANGWRVGGKSPMKDWKAAVRTWEKNGYNAPPAAKKGGAVPHGSAGSGAMGDLEKEALRRMREGAK